MTGHRKLTTTIASVALLPALMVSADASVLAPTQQRPTESVGLGDPYYPADGNPGYNVWSYHVNLQYFRPTQRIRATTTIRAKATERLNRFNLDLVGMRVRAITVNGRDATWRRAGAHELVIRPARALPRGQRVVTKVNYHGKPGFLDDGGVPSGWFDSRTPGAGFIAGEPHSCTLWYPCNDHPSDRARFAVTATVPRPFAVVSNGKQLRTTHGVRNGTRVRTYRWRLDEAVATYLTTFYVDKLTWQRSRLANGTQVVSAFGPNPGASPQRERKLPEILRVLSRRWGPYPAPQAGGIYVSGDVPFSLETYTRPIYSEGVGIGTIVHEQGHQWWGDNVTLDRWRDICFNECLASYSSWLWDGHKGTNLDRQYRREVKEFGADLWPLELYDMGAGNEFGAAVYFKGPFFVHALRNKVGDQKFFVAMRAIQRERAGGRMSMLELRNVLERRTGVDLTSFWRDWVLTTGRPSDANLFPGSLGN